MSYARFRDDCNVYVFEHVGGHIECCACWLNEGWGNRFCAETVDEMGAHLDEHRNAGHLVPDWVYEGLWWDRHAGALK